MTRRELIDRYAGQFLGLFWTIGHPLLLMGIYVVVFGSVFNNNMGGTPDEPYNYTVYLLSGLISWLSFSESLNKGPTAISSISGLVKQVVFPLEVIPVKSALTCQSSMLVSVIVLMTYVFCRYHFFLWSYWLIPILLLLQTLAIIGVQYLLSAVGVFFKDLKDFVVVFCTANFFLMPMLYVPDSLPSFAVQIIKLNPFSHMIWCFQDIFYFGHIAHPWSWIIFSSLSIAVFLFGNLLFMKLSKLFANVL